MYITVHLTPSASQGLRGGPGAAPADALRRVLTTLGIELHPLHPGTTSPELAGHFYATVDDPAKAEQVCAQLRRQPAVVAAYVKPAEGPPSAGVP